MVHMTRLENWAAGVVVQMADESDAGLTEHERAVFREVLEREARAFVTAAVNWQDERSAMDPTEEPRAFRIRDPELVEATTKAVEETTFLGSMSAGIVALNVLDAVEKHRASRSPSPAPAVGQRWRDTKTDGGMYNHGQPFTLVDHACLGWEDSEERGSWWREEEFTNGRLAYVDTPASPSPGVGVTEDAKESE